MTQILAFTLFVCGQAGTIDSKQFPIPLQEKALAATVRFDHGGSGTIVHQDRVFVYVLTASHTVKTVKRVNVLTYTATPIPALAKIYSGAEVLDRAPDEDLALVRIRTKDPMAALLRVCSAKDAPKTETFQALTVGSSGGSAPTCELREVIAKRLAQRPDAEKKVWYWETSQDQEPGRSGGPIVDAQGRLIGVCSGRNEGRGYYCHLDEVHAFLDKRGFGGFFANKK